VVVIRDKHFVVSVALVGNIFVGNFGDAPHFVVEVPVEEIQVSMNV
jgi:hypothetical protein